MVFAVHCIESRAAVDTEAAVVGQFEKRTGLKAPPHHAYTDSMPDPRKYRARDPLQPPERTFTLLRATDANVDLAREAILELHGRTPLDEGAVVEFLSDSARYLLLALEGGRVVGSLNGYALRHPHRREPQFLLYEIDVRPECRNRGIGKPLVERFIDEARAAGAYEVWVLTNQSNEPAMALYTRRGLRRRNHDDIMFSLMLNDGDAESGGSDKATGHRSD